jgi:integrase
MAKKRSAYRRHIRINGALISSPRGLNKLQADLWYNRKHNEKVALKAGILHVAESDSGQSLNEYFDGTWFQRRKKKFKLESTWGADEQRYRDYLRETIGKKKMAAITRDDVRHVLANMVDEQGLSTETRSRVKSLISKIFRGALNEKPPLVNLNPTKGIEFDDPRTGTKTPPHLRRMAEILKYFAAAEKISTLHFAYAGLALLGGLRKQEYIPIKWNDWIRENHILEINRRYIQASNTIEDGTKSGSDEGRQVPLSDHLEKILANHFIVTKHKAPSDFILAKSDGSNYSPTGISRINEEICAKAGIKINPHGLRHTFGRLFKKSGGSTGTLQTILGHSTPMVTEIYSSLAGEQVLKSRNMVQISEKKEGEDDEN